MNYKAIGLIAVLILVFDYIWLGQIFGFTFGEMVKNIQNKQMQVRVAPAAFVYLLMIVGLYVFVFTRVVDVKEAMIYGALFGLVTFGIFDFTNAALFTDYDYRVAGLDLVWGTILNAIVAGLSVYLLK